MENNNSDFKGRIDKVFGSLFQLSSGGNRGWRLGDEQVEKRQWKREESASGREDTPCGSSFDGIMNMGGNRKRSSGGRNSSWEGNFDDSDDEKENGEGSSRDNEREEDMEMEGKRMRFVVGMDSTLDQEDEEDEFDKVAVGREDAGERTYMKEIINTGPKINFLNTLPSSLSELKHRGRDPRANHYAARARLEEDDNETATAAHPDSEMVDKLSLSNKEECRKMNDDMENNELVNSNNEVEKENETGSLPAEEIKPLIQLKSIMKSKQKRAEIQQDMETEPPPLEEAVSEAGTCSPMTDSSMQKPKKRVRFEPGINGDPAGQLVKKNDLIKVVNSRKRSFVRGMGMSDSVQNSYSRVPDYIRNPSKYTHYTLDWSNEDDDMLNMQGFREFSQIVKSSASVQLEDSAEPPKSVTFIPRKRAACSDKTRENSDHPMGSQTVVEDSSENSNQTAATPLGIAAGQATETETLSLGNDGGHSEKFDSTNRNARLHKGTRQYRLKVKADEETDA